MNAIETRNVVAVEVRGETIPMFVIPQGHVRFGSLEYDDGTFAFAIFVSDKKIDNITIEHTVDKTWENQTINPVYSMHFESIEQIEAYIRAFNNFLDRVKT